MKSKRILLFPLAVAFLFFPIYAADTPDIINYPIVTPHRLDLTKQYALKHYGIDSYQMKEPKMIVVHYTVTHNLDETIRMFRNDTLGKTRPELNGGGDLNVGIQFVIDKDGKIYSLIPETTIARHTIGFNHVAIGIEVIGMNSRDLNSAQLESCIKLAAHLFSKYASIKYLIGHQEYMIKSLPHFALYTELDRTYKPTIKIDPGKIFLDNLRLSLKTRYNIELEK